MSLLQRKVIAAYGVENYMRKNNFKVTRKTVADITMDFLKLKGLPYSKFNRNYKGLNSADVCNSYQVQDHWTEFKEFLKQPEIITKYSIC